MMNIGREAPEVKGKNRRGLTPSPTLRRFKDIGNLATLVAAERGTTSHWGNRTTTTLSRGKLDPEVQREIHSLGGKAAQFRRKALWGNRDIALRGAKGMVRKVMAPKDETVECTEHGDIPEWAWKRAKGCPICREEEQEEKRGLSDAE